jgi:hypothetical protein
MSIRVRPTMYGNIAVSAMVNGYLEIRTYTGYTPKEAAAMFASRYDLDPEDAFLDVEGQKLPIPEDELEEEEE